MFTAGGVAASLIGLVKLIGPPGSWSFLLLVVILVAVLRRTGSRGRWLAGRMFACVLGLYGVMSLPIVAHELSRTLPVVPAAGLTPGQSLDALFVLDGDNVMGRVATARAAFAVAHPPRVWVLGDTWLLDQLVRAGIPSDRLLIDPRASNTREQMATVGRMVPFKSANRAAVVASAVQLPRIARLAAAARLPVTLVPSGIDGHVPESGALSCVPNIAALRLSRDALYEHAALMYYDLRGWTPVLTE